MASNGSRSTNLVLPECLVGELVEATSGDIGLELGIPVAPIELREPCAELGELLR